MMFQVHTARINYTTYDVRRAFDTVNPRTHSFVMVASPETAPNSHPFWYASVMGIFHADVQHVGKDSRDYSFRKMEFLWVRWLYMDPDSSYERQQACLPKLRFVPDSEESAFGFLDPSAVLRGCHLLPAFAEGCTAESLTASEAERPDIINEDWKSFYVGMYVVFDFMI